MDGYITKRQALQIFHGKWKKQIKQSKQKLYSDNEIFEMQREMHAEPICCGSNICSSYQVDEGAYEYGDNNIW